MHNQLHALSHNVVVVSSVQKRMEELIQTLDVQLAAVEAEVGELARADKEWGAAIVQLQSIIGIGLLTACHLVVGTLCFTNSPTPGAVSAYAGLAPMPRQSGSSIRGRSSIGHGGQGRLRTALYMATLSAIRYNPPIKAFYERLRAKGKPVKVARCAAARKLLHIAWAIVKKGCLFDPNYKPYKPPTAHESSVACTA